MHRCTIAVQLMLSTLLLVPPAAAADRYVSTSGNDTNNTACAQASPCRSVQHAVNVAGANDTISIGKGKFIESFGVTITKNLFINGAGIFSTRVQGGGWIGYSVVEVGWGATVTITNLDITSGDAETGGGILNYGNLTLQFVRVMKNKAKQGAGIFNWGTLSMFRTELSHNSAYGSGGGLSGGGGLHNQGCADLDIVRIVGNSTALGGALGNTISGGDCAVPLTVTGSDITYNDGDGIDNWGSMSVTNSTVGRNGKAGIFTGGGAATQVIHVTVADNQTGVAVQGGGEVTIVNTIVAKNKVQCSKSSASLLTVSGSLIGDGTCGVFFPGPVDGGVLIEADPKLGPLKWNGAGTFSYALKAGSPAIDAGYSALCMPTDQRGVLRSIDGNGDGFTNCDIGAIEYSPYTQVDK